MASAKIAAVSPSAVTLLRTIEMVAGVMPSLEQALEFATAAACLKHSIVGDYNRLSAQAVEALAFGGSDGRISR